MSRSQENTVNQTAAGENQTDNTNSQTSYKQAQQDEGDYQSELGKFSASNPYTQGGQFQTAENQQLSNTADAGSQAGGQAIQSAAVRTGQNPAGAIAATEAMNEANTRNLGSQEASATQQRIGNEAGYNQTVLNAQQQPASFEAQLAGQQASAAQGALGTQQQSAETPSFMDELGNGLISAGGQFAGAAGKALVGCWIAAELYEGWDDWRTATVREWIFGEFAQSWYGRLIAGAYLRFGERVAGMVRRHGWLRRVMRRVFDGALVRALDAYRKTGR